MHIYQCFITGPKNLDSTPRPVPGGAPSHVDRVPSPLAYAADPSPTALARCAHAARSTARILQSLLSHVSSPEKAWVELRDLSAVITGACMTGTVLRSVNVAKGNVCHEPATPTPGDMATNEELFNVCVEVLELVQDR
jgi:hypothetical protein